MVPLALLADESLNGNDKIVYAVLAGAADYTTRKAWPSVETIGVRAGGLGRTSVQRSLSKLKKAGWIRATVRYSEEGRQQPNIYTVVHEDRLRDKPEPVEDGHPSGHTPETLGAPLPGHRGSASGTGGAPLAGQTRAPLAGHNREPKDRDPENETFARFWSHSVRKVGKARARDLFEQVDDPEHVTAQFAHWCEWWRATETDPQYVPHPATWLSQRRWEDDLPELPEPPKPEPGPYAHHKVYVADDTPRDVTIVPMDEMRKRLR